MEVEVKSNRIFVVYGHDKEMKECCLNPKSWESKHIFYMTTKS